MWAGVLVPLWQENRALLLRQSRLTGRQRCLCHAMAVKPSGFVHYVSYLAVGHSVQTKHAAASYTVGGRLPCKLEVDIFVTRSTYFDLFVEK